MNQDILNHHEQQLALLKNKLQLPLIARDYLLADETPNAESRYALHEMMSNLQPQDALLCAAFILKEISSFGEKQNPAEILLHRECDQIIACYANKDDFNETNVTLHVFANDMERFAELIDLCQLSYDIMNEKASDLLEIISTQIHAHITIVDTVLDMMDGAQHKKMLKSAPIISGYKADNVVMFPTIN